MLGNGAHLSPPCSGPGALPNYDHGHGWPLIPGTPGSAGWRPSEMSPSPTAGTRVHGTDRRALSFVWAILPVLTLGIATPFLIAFAARRLRSRTLGWCSAGWLAAVIGWLGLAGSSQIFYSGAFSAAYNILITMPMVGGSLQAFALRP